MILSECKLCNHHICNMQNLVLCGFTIDRSEIAIKPEEGEFVLDHCPKEV